jgi:CoA:oxalate CoA-transferase
MVDGRPLHGVRVLDLSRVLAGPFAGRMLADLGADVVKVEPPEGDVTRHFGAARGGQTGYYAQQNAGKRDVCIDLTRPGGPELVRALAAVADVVIENFRPGVLRSFGLSWAELSEDHPELVMLSISGFGQEGPEAQRAAYAGILHAESGVLDRQAALSGTRADDLQLSVADTNAGLHGLIGILAALRVRDATGIGQHIDIAMVDTLLVCDDYVFWTLDGRDAPRGGGEIWDAPGGPIIVMGDFKWVWKCANERLGLADPTPPGASVGEKVAARRGAWASFVSGFADRPSLLAALDRANLAWGDVRPTSEALESPTVQHRRTVVEIDDRVGGTRRVVQSPYRFSRSESGVTGPAPRRGEHNAEVLTEWAGLDDATVEGLVGAGVLLDEG